MKLDVRSTPSRDGDQVWKSIDAFFQTYYSGLDCRIFANDILIAEIIELQWSLQEAVAPLFGYHDYVFSTVMHGARRVNGSFKINFVRDAYIFELLRQLEERPGTSATGQATSARTTDAYRVAAAGKGSADYLLGLALQDGTVPNDNQGRPRVDTQLFNQVANDFEKAIWGVSTNNDKIKNNRVNTVVNELLSETKSTSPRFELQSRFNLNIEFGSVTPERVSKRQKSGISGINNLQTVVPVSTSTRILQVALTGYDRMIDDSGRPIMENYMFIARDVV